MRSMQRRRLPGGLCRVSRSQQKHAALRLWKVPRPWPVRIFDAVVQEPNFHCDLVAGPPIDSAVCTMTTFQEGASVDSTHHESSADPGSLRDKLAALPAGTRATLLRNAVRALLRWESKVRHWHLSHWCCCFPGRQATSSGHCASGRFRLGFCCETT